MLAACLLGDLAAAALGYATGGADGGAIGAIAFALGVGIVAGLLLVVGVTVGRPAQTRIRPVTAGAIAVAGWTVIGVSVLDSGPPGWTYVAAASLVGVSLGTTAESPQSGLWHGLLTCGSGGVLTVYLSIYESFTMRPELTGIVILGSFLVPLALGIAGGLGSAVGVLTHEAVERRRVSE
jgi:uncharacterized membrane protein